MRDGFTFCDTDIADIGLHYAPELQDTYVYAPSETDSHVETFEGHDGGYYFGSWKQPKDIVLRCYFESSHINKGIMSKVYYLFKVGRTGKLVFEKRPWCYYIATVTSKPELDLTNYRNGLVTITMKATYPFAQSDILFRDYPLGHEPEVSEYRNNMLLNTAVYEKEEMVPPSSFALTANKTLLLGNPGTERAPLSVQVSGDAQDITINNTTTGQVMVLRDISKAVTTDVSKTLYVDSLTGKTMLKGESNELAFRYHVSGFLELEPGYPAIRNIFISYSGGNQITASGFFPDGIVDLYIFADGEWRRIQSQPDRRTITVSGNPLGTGSEKTQIMLMNEIVITSSETMDIDISFVFRPTYS